MLTLRLEELIVLLSEWEGNENSGTGLQEVLRKY